MTFKLSLALIDFHGFGTFYPTLIHAFMSFYFLLLHIPSFALVPTCPMEVPQPFFFHMMFSILSHHFFIIELFAHVIDSRTENMGQLLNVNEHLQLVRCVSHRIFILFDGGRWYR